MQVAIIFNINLDKYQTPNSEISRILLHAKDTIAECKRQKDKNNFVIPINDSSNNNIGNICLSF